eukprot:TRINITY_DN310_c1_g1_i3.p1 TRINITY_DN310_c1_g1~~TRINITY_DN310_c1_g1_i3.p1  ORF type:complete len:1322 (+),score=412.73 TRINITY_DN310_c1_g1_i3:133-4098(+)
MKKSIAAAARWKKQKAQEARRGSNSAENDRRREDPKAAPPRQPVEKEQPAAARKGPVLNQSGATSSTSKKNKEMVTEQDLSDLDDMMGRMFDQLMKGPCICKNKGCPGGLKCLQGIAKTAASHDVGPMQKMVERLDNMLRNMEMSPEKIGAIKMHVLDHIAQHFEGLYPPPEPLHSREPHQEESEEEFEEEEYEEQSEEEDFEGGEEEEEYCDECNCPRCGSKNRRLAAFAPRPPTPPRTVPKLPPRTRPVVPEDFNEKMDIIAKAMKKSQVQKLKGFPASSHHTVIDASGWTSEEDTIHDGQSSFPLPPPAKPTSPTSGAGAPGGPPRIRHGMLNCDDLYFLASASRLANTVAADLAEFTSCQGCQELRLEKKDEPPLPTKWICPKCDEPNKAEREKCNNCAAPKPPQPSFPKGAASNSGRPTMAAGKAEASSDGPRKKSPAAPGQGKGKAGGKGGHHLSSQFADAFPCPSAWHCMQCQEPNEVARRSCFTCGYKRPESQGGAPSKSSKKSSKRRQKAHKDSSGSETDEVSFRRAVLTGIKGYDCNGLYYEPPDLPGLFFSVDSAASHTGLYYSLKVVEPDTRTKSSATVQVFEEQRCDVIRTLTVGGFHNAELNGIYKETNDPSLSVAGHTTFWHEEKDYFMYYCMKFKRWRIADEKYFEDSRGGGSHGAAEAPTDANPSKSSKRWHEWRNGKWLLRKDAGVRHVSETKPGLRVIAACLDEAWRMRSTLTKSSNLCWRDSPDICLEVHDDKHSVSFRVPRATPKTAEADAERVAKELLQTEEEEANKPSAKMRKKLAALSAAREKLQALLADNKTGKGLQPERLEVLRSSISIVERGRDIDEANATTDKRMVDEAREIAARLEEVLEKAREAERREREAEREAERAKREEQQRLEKERKAKADAEKKAKKAAERQAKLEEELRQKEEEQKRREEEARRKEEEAAKRAEEKRLKAEEAAKEAERKRQEKAAEVAAKKARLQEECERRAQLEKKKKKQAEEEEKKRQEEERKRQEEERRRQEEEKRLREEERKRHEEERERARLEEEEKREQRGREKVAAVEKAKALQEAQEKERRKKMMEQAREEEVRRQAQAQKARDEAARSADPAREAAAALLRRMQGSEVMQGLQAKEAQLRGGDTMPAPPSSKPEARQQQPQQQSAAPAAATSSLRVPPPPPTPPTQQRQQQQQPAAQAQQQRNPAAPTVGRALTQPGDESAGPLEVAEADKSAGGVSEHWRSPPPPQAAPSRWPRRDGKVSEVHKVLVPYSITTEGYLTVEPEQWVHVLHFEGPDEWDAGGWCYGYLCGDQSRCGWFPQRILVQT